jgi:hypothetical protein
MNDEFDNRKDDDAMLEKLRAENRDLVGRALAAQAPNPTAGAALQRAIVAMTEARLALLDAHAALHPNTQAVLVARIIKRFDGLEETLRVVQKEVK